MTYWTCVKYRNGIKFFIKGTDEAGYPLETKNEFEAYHFKNFDQAMMFYDMGYSIFKH